MDVANRKEGRFIPYIGKDYEKGLVSKDKDAIGRFSRDSDKDKSNVKILVIGPRHYCDAGKSRRNRFASLTKKDLEDMNCGKSKNIPADPKLVCMRDDALACLKDNPDNCPVFRNEDARCCPVSKECNIKESFPCNKERNLRCETLIAIKDYLDSIRVIESQNIGKHFFNSITNIIDKVYKPKSKDSKYIWSCIAFSNLIQRYISTSLTEDDEIRGFIVEDDRKFMLEVVEQLKPQIIIATNKCVKTKLKTVFRNLLYEERKLSCSGDFYIFERNNNEVITDKWKQILKECIEKSPFWKKSSQYNGFLNGVLKGFKDKNLMPSMKDDFLPEVQALLTDKIEKGLKEGEMVDKYMLKTCLLNKNEHDSEKIVSTIWDWLRKYNPKSRVQLSSYNKGIEIFDEILQLSDT